MYHKYLTIYSNKTQPIDIKKTQSRSLFNSINSNIISSSPSKIKSKRLIVSASPDNYFTKKKYYSEKNQESINISKRFQTYFPELYEKLKYDIDVMDELMFYNLFPYRGENFKKYVHDKILVIIEKYNYDKELSKILFNFINDNF